MSGGILRRLPLALPVILASGHFLPVILRSEARRICSGDDTTSGSRSFASSFADASEDRSLRMTWRGAQDDRGRLFALNSRTARARSSFGGSCLPHPRGQEPGRRRRETSELIQVRGREDVGGRQMNVEPREAASLRLQLNEPLSAQIGTRRRSSALLPGGRLLRFG